MNEYDNSSGSSGTSLWQQGMSLLCLLGALVEYIALTQREPFYLYIDLPGSNTFLGIFFLIIGLVTFGLPAVLFFFKATDRNEQLYALAWMTTLLGVVFSVWLYCFKAEFMSGYAKALLVLVPIQFLKLLLSQGLRRRGYADPIDLPDLYPGSAPASASAYTLNLVVCGVCGRKYASAPGAHCPGCTAPVEDAVPLEDTPRGGWWKLWQAPSRGQRLAATALLLLNVLLLGAHVLQLRDLAPVLIGLLVLDAVLAALMWTPVGVVPVLVRAVLGLGLGLMLFEPNTPSFLGIAQIVLGVSLGVLLVHRFGGAFWLLAVPGPLLYTVLVGVLVYSLATANAYAPLLAMWLTGAIEREAVSRVEGRAEPYVLSLPPGSWYPLARKQADTLQVDVALSNPALEMNIAVASQRIPQGVSPQGLERVENAIKTEMSRHKSGLKWGTSRELPGSWDEARGVGMRARLGGLMYEHMTALFQRGDRLFIVMASAPAWRSPDPRPLLEELVGGLRYEPPSPPFLSEALAQRVKQATVRVLTPRGRGSGFLIQDEGGYSILTARHVLRSANGQREPQEARVVFSGEPAVERIATVRAVDPRLDLALLHLPFEGPEVGSAVGAAAGPRRAALSFRGTPLVKDTPVVAGDFPWNEPFQPGVFRSQPTLHLGTVTATEAPAPPSYPDFSARLAQMAPGPLPLHSGGPVVDLGGAVVGMIVGDVLGTKTSVLVPTGRLLPFLKAAGARTREDTSPPAQDAFPAPVREALESSLVSVLEPGRPPRVGVVVRVPGSKKGLVLTAAGSAQARGSLRVGFFSPATRTWRERPGTVLLTQPYQKNTLALLEVEPFPELPPGLALQESSRLSETDRLALGGLRQVEGTPHPVQRLGAVQEIDWASRWKRGPQSPTRLRVAVDLGGLFKPGPAVDEEGTLVGYALQGSAETGRVEFVAAEPLRELLRGPVRAVAARAVRELQGGCQVEFFVDAQEGVSGPRTVSLAVAAPDPSREDALVPVFGPERDLGPLPGSGGRLRLSLPACPEAWLIYRLQLTSALGVQRVEGRLPLPTRALERTQAPAPLTSEEGAFKLRDFLEWKAEQAPADPSTPEAALAACVGSWRACGFITKRVAAATVARERAQLLHPLQEACRQRQGAACLAWAEVAGLQAPPGPTPALPEVRMALGLGCDAGLAEACSRLGQFLVRQAAQEKLPAAMLADWTLAARLLRKACEAGSAEGCSGLAELLSLGQGVEKDEALALREYRRACRLQDARACLKVGFLNEAPSASRVLNRTYEALRESCLLGLEEGCGELSRFLNQQW